MSQARLQSDDREWTRRQFVRGIRFGMLSVGRPLPLFG